jgi:predicted GIY-YIG superfamily endonuclease
VREKRIKARKREWRVTLIEKGNPSWRDRYNTLS